MRKSRESKDGTPFLFLTFYFEVIVDSHAVIRNNTEKSHILLSIFPNGNILHNYSIPHLFSFWQKALRISRLKKKVYNNLSDNITMGIDQYFITNMWQKRDLAWPWKTHLIGRRRLDTCKKNIWLRRSLEPWLTAK